MSDEVETTEDTSDDLTEGSVFVAMNQDGSWEVADDEDDATSRLLENHQRTVHIRVAQIDFKMRPPSAPPSVEVIVPDDATESEIEVEEEEAA